MRWRQRGSRYAIRAGRNLPDKEFRYLRTVIVTAAVYRGFNSELCTPPLNLPAPGRRQTLYVAVAASQSPMFLSKQSPPPGLCHHTTWLPKHVVSLLANLRRAFCRVPSTHTFSQAPWYSLPVYLCRFRVRSNVGAISWNIYAAQTQSNKDLYNTSIFVTHPLAQEY